MIKRLLWELYPPGLIAWRETRDLMRDWRIYLPIFGLTIFFPVLMNLTAKAAIDFATQYGAPLIGERFVPFLLMVVGFFPITVSLVIALESFVGEKERGTIEPLLSSPIKDWQLFLGKLLAGSAAPLVAAYIGITVYLIGLKAQEISLPDINRLAQTLILTTAQAILMVCGAILISTQATSIRAANLMASFIIIPISLLIQGESILMFWGTHQILWYAVVAVLILSILLVRTALAHFQRESILGHEFDILNIRWIISTLLHFIKGDANNLLSWYGIEIRRSLHKARVAILITCILGTIALIISYSWFNANDGKMIENIKPGTLISTLGSDLNISEAELSFTTILWHNLRALLVISLLGFFSFGVLGMLLFMMNMGIIGAVVQILGSFGYPQVPIIVFGILPHGIFEIPALVISCASILYFGILLVTPAKNKSIGVAFLEGVSEWAKMNIGLAIPLLILAAAVETWITPSTLSIVLK